MLKGPHLQPADLNLAIKIVLSMLMLLIHKGETTSLCDESTERCVCSMKATLQYLDENAVVSRSILSREPDVVLHRIQKYDCIEYEQLPDALVIRWSGQSRLPSRRRRYRRSAPKTYRFSESRDREEMRSADPALSMDFDDTRRDHNHRRIQSRRNPRDTVKPLGYPSDEVMAEVIPRLPQKSQHQYVPLGGEAILRCFSPQDVVEESSWLDRKFQWFHSDGREVSAPEMFLDKETGDLTLKAVQLTDTDMYTCKVSYKPGGDVNSFESAPSEETLEHKYQLDVIAESIAWLRFAVIYSGESCNQEEMLLIQENVLLWVQKYVCHFCPVRNHSVSCVAHDLNRLQEEDDSRTFRDVRIRFAMSTMGLEHRTTSFGVYTEACPLTCVETLHVKLLQIAQDSLEKMFRLEIDLESSLTDKASTYSSQPETINADVAVGCPSGFFSNYKLCFPCPAGSFSPSGNTDCSKCSVGHFQPTPGSSVCFPCPHGYSTSGEGSIAMFDCKAEFFVAAIGAMESNWLSKSTGSAWFGGIILISIILVPIILAVCLIPCCCPKSKLGRWFAPCSCCAPDPDFELLEEDNGKTYSTDGSGSETNGQTDDETYNRKKSWKGLGKKKSTVSDLTKQNFQAIDSSKSKAAKAAVKSKKSTTTVTQLPPKLQTLSLETEKASPKRKRQENSKLQLDSQSFKPAKSTSVSSKKKSQDDLQGKSKSPTKEIEDLMTFHASGGIANAKSKMVHASSSAAELKRLQSGSVQTSNPKLLSTRSQTSNSKLTLPSIFTQTSTAKLNLNGSHSTQTKKNVRISHGPPLTKYITSSSDSGTDFRSQSPVVRSLRTLPTQSSSQMINHQVKPINDYHDLHINIDERKKKLEESMLQRHHHNPSDDTEYESNASGPGKVLLPPWGHPKYKMIHCSKKPQGHGQQPANPNQLRNTQQLPSPPPPPPPPLSVAR